jgi:hypothetical protein
MKYSLDQLQYANEICFDDEFIELFDKSAIGTPFEGDGRYYYAEKKRHKRDLLQWIFAFSRASRKRGYGTIIEKMLAELIGDYK